MLTQLMNLGLVPWLGHAGLALSISLGALLNAGLLWAGLRRAGAFRPAPGWPAFLGKVAAATALMGSGLAWSVHAIDWIGLHGSTAVRIALLAAVLVGAAGVYFGTLAALGIRARDFARRG